MAWIPEPGSGGVSDHGELDGLADDDHTQYLNTVRHAAIDAADHGSGAATAGQVLTADGAGGAAWKDPTGGGAFAETIGDNSNTSFQVQHNLGTQDLVVQLWDLTGAEPIEATGDASQIEINDDNTITVTFSAAPATDSYRVVILASGGSAGGGGGGGGRIIVRSVPPVSSVAASSSPSVTKGQFFTPQIDVAVHALGFIGNWNSAITYRLRLVELDGSRSVVGDVIDDTFSPLTSGYSELFVAGTGSLSAGTEYAAMCTALGQAANHPLPITWPTSDCLPSGPWYSPSGSGFRISDPDPSSLSSPAATANNSLQFVLYWEPLV